MATTEKKYTILWYLDGEEVGTSTFGSLIQSVDELQLSLTYSDTDKKLCTLNYLLAANNQYAKSYTYSVDIDSTKGEFTADSVNDTIVVRNFSLVLKKSVDLTTLSGWENLSDGTHNITIKAKASGYADSNASESVVVTKSSSSGETWVLNEEPDTGNVSKTEINFKSNNTDYVAIEANTMNAGPQSIYYYKDSSTYDVAREYGTWSNESYKTITFETAPTDDLLTWLQANGTKQSGGGSVIKAGTYVIKESPTLNIDIDITLNGKMNTLIADDIYGEMTTFDNFAVIASSPVQIGMANFINTENEMTINYAPDTWTFLSDDEYTTTDTTKIRTIVIESDQNVTQEIKTWWDENTSEKTVYTVTYTNLANSSAPCKYNLNGGNTWTTITEPSGTIENVETIQFRLGCDGIYACAVKSTTLGLNENSILGSVTTDTYTLTEDVTDLTITMTPAK